MKKNILLLLGTIIININVIAQSSVITLQPEAELGKDANINSYWDEGDKNYGEGKDMHAMAWTIEGTLVLTRNLIDFDLSSIPNNVTIDSVKLSLFAYESPSNGSHSTRSGSNEAVLCRVTSPWEENTVTWNNQPSVTEQNQIFLFESDSSNQDYLNIDVTNLVLDMLDDPENSHGFLLKLVTEEHYRSLIFASSDNDDSNLHPKLEIYYSIPNDNKIVLNSNWGNGKDANINSYWDEGDKNYGEGKDMHAMAWTIGGTLVLTRNLIDFDLSSIPNNVTIDSVKLSLFAYESPSNGSHSTRSGSNEAILCRVTSPWEENTVTWNNQPSVTEQNQVFLSESDSSNQDYLNIDVTNLVLDMLDDPENSHGFLLKLVTEEHYRSLIFASSDNDDPSLYPKLEIYYSNSSTTFISEKKSDNDWRIYPNPANNYITIDLNNINQDLIKIDIISSAGQIVRQISNIQTTFNIDVTDFYKGFYFIRIHNNNFVSIKKFFVN